MATTMKKETKSQKFARLLTLSQVQADPTLVEFIKHEQELLEKKNSTDKKPTKTQVANEVLKTAIVEGMQENRLYTVTELIKEIPELAELTNQKVSSLMRQLTDAGKVTRAEEKRKAYFTVVVE